MPAEVSCVYELRRCAGLGWAGNYYHIQLTQLPLRGPQSCDNTQRTFFTYTTQRSVVSAGRSHKKLSNAVIVTLHTHSPRNVRTLLLNNYISIPASLNTQHMFSETLTAREIMFICPEFKFTTVQKSMINDQKNLHYD